MKKGILWITNLLLGSILLMLAALVLPGLWGYQVFYVASGSMSPRIRAGAAVYVRNCNFETLQPGDVITYTLDEGKSRITHRIVGIDEKQHILQTKGDANQQEDAVWISESAIIGKVYFHIPQIGKAAWFLSDWQGKLWLLGVILWLLGIQMFVEEWFGPARKRKKYGRKEAT